MTDRHAVVTGGGRGLGAAIASALAAGGARLTLMGRTEADLDAHASALAAAGRARAQAVPVDVGDQESVRRAFAEAVARQGPVHILVNNAGQSDTAPFADVTLEHWERMLRVNLTGTFLCTREVLPAMVSSGWGRVVNIASTAGLKGAARIAPYCAAKHGVVGLTRALAVETAKAGVTVNAVCPGYVDDTDMLRRAVENVSRATGKPTADARAVLERLSPRGSLVTPVEVAAAVVWLCSPASSAITGQAIPVAGGEVMS